MGIFGARGDSRRQGNSLPHDVSERLARFGRFEFGNAPDDSNDVWAQTIQPLYDYARNDPQGFMSAVINAVPPGSGWASCGAGRMIWELLNEESRYGDAFESIIAASLDFLRINFVPPMRLSGYEWDFWTSHGGTVDTWIPRLPSPSPSIEIRPLGVGEVRELAQWESTSDSNRVLITLDETGTYRALIDAKQDDENPTRSQWEWMSAPTQFALYTDIGLSLQMRPFKYDPQLEPFFPIPRSKI